MARKHRKVPTTSVKVAEVHGVALSSRYDKANEFETMACMVRGVSSDLRQFIDSVWCDSKANACYSVILKPCTRGQARRIAEELDAACVAREGGHNGISIQGAQGGGFDVGPNWVGDF